jgi:hypothetical protein
VRAAALDIISGLTAAPDGVAQLAPVQSRLLASLLRLVPCGGAADDDELPTPASAGAASSSASKGSSVALSRAALSALVNLTQEPRWAAAALQHGVVGRLMEFLRDKACPHSELLVRAPARVRVCCACWLCAGGLRG